MTAPGFVARSRLGVVRVTGADRLAYLDDVTSQHLRDAPAGSVMGALHLDPNGNVLAVMDVVLRPDDLLLLVPDGLVEHAVEVLGGRTFLLDATFEPTQLRVASIRDTEGDELPVIGAVPAHGEVVERDGSLVLGRAAGVDVVAPAGKLDELIAALTETGVTEGDDAVLDDWRIHAGIPRWGREVTAGRLPEELGLLPSHVHLAKGCYPGQEAVARMWMLGRPRRRLALVSLSGPVGPGWQAGEGRERVEVTSVTSDGEVGLAFVPEGSRSGVVAEADDSTSVTVRRLIGDTLDVPGHDPAMTRRRDRRRSEAGAQ